MAKEDGFKLNCDYDVIGERLRFSYGEFNSIATVLFYNLP